MKTDSSLHLTSDDRGAVMEYIARIRSRFPDRILSVTLFGSKACGDADAESDVDLLVLVDADDNEFRYELWRIASRVSLEYDVVISQVYLARFVGPRHGAFVFPCTAWLRRMGFH